MAKIRHIAISSPDPGKAAKFYQEVFGLKEVGKSANGAAYFLSDGDINVAIANFNNEPKGAAGPGTARMAGGGQGTIHHFGFQVESLEEPMEKRESANAKPLNFTKEGLGLLRGGAGQTNVELKYVGPDGVTIDVSQNGWAGPPGRMGN